jgi:hypothetical protein
MVALLHGLFFDNFPGFYPYNDWDCNIRPAPDWPVGLIVHGALDRPKRTSSPAILIAGVDKIDHE